MSDRHHDPISAIFERVSLAMKTQLLDCFSCADNPMNSANAHHMVCLP
jgi:hypothetical protein